MRLLNIKVELLFLISFILYGCSSLSQPLQLHNAETEAQITTTPLSLPEKETNDIFLIKSIDPQIYYITNLSDTSMVPLNIPINIRGLAMSPNGRTIAYITNENSTLYLFDIKSQTSSTLTNSDFQPGIGLTWSPDSQSIAFSCRVQNTLGLSLCLVNINNSENVQVLVKSEILNASDVLDGAISPSWDSDGQRIVFLSSIAPSTSSLGRKIVSTKDIWLFDFSTNSAKLVFPNKTDGISYIFAPVLLPEDNSILFSGRAGNFNTIFDYKINSRQTQNITFTDDSFDLVDFVLSPDRKSFLVHVPTLENSTQNFIPTLYSIDGHLLKQLNSLTNFQVISWSIQE